MKKIRIAMIGGVFVLSLIVSAAVQADHIYRHRGGYHHGQYYCQACNTYHPYGWRHDTYVNSYYRGPGHQAVPIHHAPVYHEPVHHESTHHAPVHHEEVVY